MKRYLGIITCLMLAFASSMSARIIYVNGSSSNTVENGESWSTAYKKLEVAIDTADAGDELWVAKGSYLHQTADFYEPFIIEKDLHLYGGFAGTENSIITRDLEQNPSWIVAIPQHTMNSTFGFHFGNNVNVHIDGFAFKEIYCPFQVKSWGNGENISLDIRNCKFFKCYAMSRFYQASGINVKFSSCEIEESWDSMNIENSDEKPSSLEII
ncbi:MAG TPA: hypothetical protein VL947_08425, partial [Cytophagales bacterium]|nr:hypothetical protein [Cytophagales bacterium]